MELTLFLSAKDIVSHMARDELKYLNKNVIIFCFSTKQFCIIKSFLLHSPSYHKAIKPYISIQAAATSVSDIRVFLVEGQKGKLLVTYCIHCCQIFTVLQNKHFNGG
jgi:hypothetical protein